MLQELKNKLKANFPLISIQTHEETRVENEIIRTCREANRSAFFRWTITGGMVGVNLQTGMTTDRVTDPEDPRGPYAAIEQLPEKAVIAILDPAPYWSNPVVVRAVRDAIPTCKNRMITVILIGAEINIPRGLEHEVSPIDFALPTGEEIETEIRSMCEETGTSVPSVTI